ncbi:MAG: hypothetical protein N2484_08840 [Clostridia bacterium]|nr:hypothetical protein [Clostridia bacterium]
MIYAVKIHGKNKIYGIMVQKGWYQTQNAIQQDIGRAQQEAGSIQSSLNA